MIYDTFKYSIPSGWVNNKQSALKCVSQKNKNIVYIKMNKSQNKISYKGINNKIIEKEKSKEIFKENIKDLYQFNLHFKTKLIYLKEKFIIIYII